MNHNVWEPETLAMIRYCLRVKPNSVYVDFGAWVGPTAIFASSYARKVYALEPGEAQAGAERDARDATAPYGER